jgi:hypothetical protein
MVNVSGKFLIVSFVARSPQVYMPGTLIAIGVYPIFLSADMYQQAGLYPKVIGTGLLRDLHHFSPAAAFARFLADGAACAAVTAATGIFGCGNEVQLFAVNGNNRRIACNCADASFAKRIPAGTLSRIARHGLAVAAVTARTHIDTVPFFVHGKSLVGERNNCDQKQASNEQTDEDFFHGWISFSIIWLTLNLSIVYPDSGKNQI